MISRKANILIILSGIIAVIVLLGPFLEYYLFASQQADSNSKQQADSATKTDETPSERTLDTINIKENQHQQNPEWVPGKSLKDCMNGQNEINEDVMKCHNGYYINLESGVR